MSAQIRGLKPSKVFVTLSDAKMLDIMSPFSGRVKSIETHLLLNRPLKLANPVKIILFLKLGFLDDFLWSFTLCPTV